jgi:hypothetical protein
MLHPVFERALHDRVVTFNPCAHTELPQVVKRKARTLTPTEYAAILTALPAQHRLMVETAIDTCLRWGELIAVNPATSTWSRVGSPSRRPSSRSRSRTPPPASGCSPSPTQRQRTPHHRHPAGLVTQLEAHIADRRLKSGDLLFATRDGTRSLATPSAPGCGVHDLRNAHPSWLLAGGSDLKSVMDRMGHAQITTTQKYLHTLPDADQENLTALDLIRNTDPDPDRPRPGWMTQIGDGAHEPRLVAQAQAVANGHRTAPGAPGTGRRQGVVLELPKAASNTSRLLTRRDAAVSASQRRAHEPTGAERTRRGDPESKAPIRSRRIATGSRRLVSKGRHVPQVQIAVPARRQRRLESSPS